MSPLGDRPLGFIAREAVRPSNWVALARMPRRYRHPLDGARRYFTPGGAYPYRCEVRTPLGIVAPTLHSQHDMITVNEIFCREDYRVGAEAEVVVDVGSNIGISALYFLTRSETGEGLALRAGARGTSSACARTSRLRGALAARGGGGRRSHGEEIFSIEPTGRYGGLGHRARRVDPGARPPHRRRAAGGARGGGPDRRAQARHGGRRGADACGGLARAALPGRRDLRRGHRRGRSVRRRASRPRAAHRCCGSLSRTRRPRARRRPRSARRSGPR